MNLPEGDDFDLTLPAELSTEDKWILSQYNRLVAEVTDNLEKFELGVAVSKLYDFIWDVFCDWYIELTKPRLQAGGGTAMGALRVLVYVMSGTLKLLHPFMPFITEEIWQALPHQGESIMIAQWPVWEESLNYAAEEAEFTRVMDAIKAVRNVRTEMNVPPSKKASLFIETKFAETFLASALFFQRLASASTVEVEEHYDMPGAVQVITDSARVFIPMDELIDREKELARLAKEKASCEKDIEFVMKKLSNEGFVAKAPAKVIENEREKLAKAQEKLQKIEQSIAAFSK
mgnify:FL=1